MKEQNQGMTGYQKKFMIALAMAQVGLTIMAVSVFGVHFYNRTTKWQAYTKDMTAKFEYLKKQCAVWMSPEEYKLKKMEWEYNTQGAEGGVGAEVLEKGKEQQK